jgi:hypothetical protein
VSTKVQPLANLEGMHAIKIRGPTANFGAIGVAIPFRCCPYGHNG